MRFDFRRPPFAPPVEVLYAAALDQVEWADALGFETVVVSQHYESDDG